MKDFDVVNIYREIVQWIHLLSVQTQIHELQGNPKVKRNLFCEFVLVQTLLLFWDSHFNLNEMFSSLIMQYAIPEDKKLTRRCRCGGRSFLLIKFSRLCTLLKVLKVQIFLKSIVYYPRTKVWGGTKTSLICSRSTTELFNKPWLSQRKNTREKEE